MKKMKVAKAMLRKEQVVLRRSEREIEKRKNNKPTRPQFLLKKFLQMVSSHMGLNMNILNRLTCKLIRHVFRNFYVMIRVIHVDF